MSDDKVAWDLLHYYTKKNSRFSMFIPVIFTITGVTTIITGVLSTNTEEEAYRFLFTGLGIGFSVMLLLYIINWFFCWKFLKKMKMLTVEEKKLKRSVNGESNMLYIVYDTNHFFYRYVWFP